MVGRCKVARIFIKIDGCEATSASVNLLTPLSLCFGDNRQSTWRPSFIVTAMTVFTNLEIDLEVESQCIYDSNKNPIGSTVV